jgi:transcriptional regulator of acetoin/glycerol metabolism
VEAHECLPMGAGSLRAEIRKSWRRSELGGLAHDQPIDRLGVAEVDTSSRLMVAARPVLEEMAEQLAGTRYCTVLADADCRIVHRWFDSPGVERALDGISAVPGSQFSEQVTGTNGVGTPVEVRRGVVVHGEEHFVDALKPFSCYGHPIVHPLTRRIEGVLDITGITKDANPMLAPFLTRAVRDVERRLLAGSRASEQRLLHAFQAATQQRTRPVVVLGEDVVLTNKAAIDLLDSTDHGMLRALAADASEHRSWTRRVTLSSGTDAWVRARRIAGTQGGLLLDLDRIADAEHVPVPRGAPRPSRETALARRFRELRDVPGTVLITGEPGSGRTTAVRAVAGARVPHVLDAASVPGMGERTWAQRLEDLAARARRPGALLVVEEIQLLPDALCTLLAKVTGARPGPPTVLTSGPAGQLGPVAASLAASCHARTDLPPLRERVDELPELVRRMLAQIRPGAHPRCTPSTLEVLAAQPWLGNLRELDVVLRQVAERRSTGDVTPADLPPDYRAAPRAARLAGRERAERSAIVEALEVTGGNKVHAAERLGISRTTLYSRMRALGVPR